MNKQVQPQNPFQPVIKVHDFEGPLDLLLHLIKQSEMADCTFGTFPEWIDNAERQEPPSVP